MVVVAVLGIATVWTPLSLGTGRLQIEPLPPADLALQLTEPVMSPSGVQARGITALSGMNLVLAGGALIASLCTLILLAVAKAADQRTELFVRRAVGASRRRLFGAGMREALLLAIVVLAVGAAIGLLSLRSARATWPGSVGSVSLALPLVIALTVVATIGLAILVPLKSIGRVQPNLPPLTPLLIPAVCVIQLAVGFAVLVESRQVRAEGTALVRTDRRAATAGTVFRLEIPAAPAERARQLAELMRRSGLSGLFDVASLSSPGALEGVGTVTMGITECGACYQGGIGTPLRPVAISLNVVSADTFRALNTDLIEGRLLNNSDDFDAWPVAVISEDLARGHFEGGHALGRRIQVGQGANSRFTVVGVVKDPERRGLGAPLQPSYTVYASVLQLAPRAVEFLVRPRSAIDWIRVLSLLPPGTLKARATESETQEQRAAPVRWFGTALSLEAAAVGLIALLGIALSMSIWVNSMLPDLAVHRFVGARRRNVFTYVTLRGGPMVLVGIGMGLLVAFLTAGPLSAIVPSVQTLDTAGLGSVAGLVISVTALAAGVPAWRASRLSPAELLAST